MTENESVPCLRNGEWTEIPGPIDLDETWEDQLGKLGFESWIGEDEGNEVIALWIRRGTEPRCAVMLSGPARGELVWAWTVPDGMDLMARWAPVFTSLQVIAAIEDLRFGHDSRSGLVGRAVRLAREAWK